jgi:Ca-activated chloride channel family protein
VSHRSARRLGAASLALALVACQPDAPAPPEESAPAAADPPAPPRHVVRLPAETGGTAPRGLGTMTARAPGTTETIAGVRLLSHHVRVQVHDGFARTEVEEEFQNDTGRVLEGRYVFPVPPEASLSRLGLWVGKELVEGEMVERERAAMIFRSIVEDTVRPRDPALLEWTSASELSLKVFPLPPHGSRKVVLAYDQALAPRDGRARYVYPLSLGADRATRIEDFDLRVTASDSAGPLGAAETPGYAARITPDRGGLDVGFHAQAFTPPGDFLVTFALPEPRPAPDTLPATVITTREDAADRFVAVRVPIAWPAGAAPPARVRRDRAVVVDVSHSQSRETLAGAVAVAESVISALEPDERFVLLACDSACVTFPEDGLAAAETATLDAAADWLRARRPGGSSDVAGALLAAAHRLDPGGAGQLVMLGDGAPTSGELFAETIAARVGPEIAARQIDVRLLGAGRTVDAVVLAGLARALGGSYEPLGDGTPLAQRLEEVTLALRAPLLRGATLTGSAGLSDVYPRELPTLHVGGELLVLARLTPGATGGEVRLAGDLGGVAFATARPVTAHEQSPVVPRLWAAARIAELEASEGAAAAAEVVALSKRHHVLSRRTSLIVLENDRMFAEFGIPRTQAAPRDPGLGSVGTLGRGAGSHAAAGSAGVRESVTFGHNARPPSRDVGDGADPQAPPSRGGDLASFGAIGLGLSGVGEGGAGRGQGFGSGTGRLGGSHLSRSPVRVRQGSVSVSGRLPPEVIQRIARQNFGRFRLCYENGLRSNPNLAGQVVVRFVIGRDGAVISTGNGGSSLPDGAVVACVVRAFAGLSFPQPEGGTVTVTFPISFTSDGGDVPWRSSSDGPTATHQAGDERWMSGGEGALDKLREAVAADGESRQRHEALVRGLLGHGRFADALAAARRFADLDPDLDRARELLAGAAAAAGDADTARTALDAAVELSPRSADLHTRAARAFEAGGDETRACAHWRSLAALLPRGDDLRYQAWRCRARLGEGEAVLGELRAEEKPSRQATTLLAALATGAAPAYDPATASGGVFEVTVRCQGESPACPVAMVVKPSGDVVSPWEPAAARASAGGVALPSTPDGTYRTLLVGGAPDARGEVTVRAHASTRTFKFEHGGLQTVAATTVTNPQQFFGFR